MKKLIKIVLVLLILVVALVGVAVFKIDSIVKAAIEEGGSYALGVDTTVDSVNVGLLSGTFGMAGLTIGNPEGFPAEHLMKSGDFNIDIDSGTLRQDTVVINELVIDGLHVNIEKKDDQYNVTAITDYMSEKFGGGEETTPDPEPAEDDAPGKQVVVKKVVVKNITAKVDAGGIVGTVELKQGDIPDIVLENVSQDNLPIRELIAQLFPAIMAGVVTGLPGELTDLSTQLTGDLTSAAQALGGDATKLLNASVANVSESLSQVTEQIEQVTEQLEGATEQIEGATENIQGALEGITGGGDSGPNNNEEKEEGGVLRGIGLP